MPENEDIIPTVELGAEPEGPLVPIHSHKGTDTPRVSLADLGDYIEVIDTKDGSISSYKPTDIYGQLKVAYDGTDSTLCIYNYDAGTWSFLTLADSLAVSSHASTHENTGSDEISLEDLDGTPTATVNLDSAQTIGGVKTFDDIPLLPATNPTTDNQAARKKYVDDATVPQVLVGGACPAVDNVTNYCGFGGILNDTTDANAQARMPFTCTAGSFWVYCETNTSTIDVVMRVRRNGKDTLIAVTIPASTTGVFTNDTDSTIFVTGDLISMGITKRNATTDVSAASLKLTG